MSASKDEDAIEGGGNAEGGEVGKKALGKRASPSMSSKEQQPHKSARTGTQPPTQATQQRHAAPTKPSPAAAVKAAQGGSRVLSGTRVATRGKFVLVCGRTAEREEMASAVCHLGGQSAYVHGFLMNATHVIVKDLRRTEKFLCACAAGRWILKPVYIEACKSNNQWLQEQSFEWNNARKVDKDQKDLWHGAPRRWRQYWVSPHISSQHRFVSRIIYIYPNKCTAFHLA